MPEDARSTRPAGLQLSLEPGGMGRSGALDGERGQAGGTGDEQGRRLVEVAIDAAGGGGNRTYTYHVPDRLDDLAAGEAVLVGYGRRQALAVVLGPAREIPPVATRPILERVRADGPLLPPLSLRLARWIAATYLAPPAVVLRAMLPPRLLERLELIAERAPMGAPAGGGDGTPASSDGGGDGTPASSDGGGDGTPASSDGGAGALPTSESTSGTALADLSPADRHLLEQLDSGPRALRDLAAPEGRAGLLRRARALAGRGLIRLDWTLAAAGAGPRYGRWLGLTDEGVALSGLVATGARPPGRPLGPRQLGLLGELAEAGGPVPAPTLLARHGAGAAAGLVRRGLVYQEVREVERRPLDRRPPGRRGSRPPAAALTSAQAEALDLVRSALATADPTPLLLDGVTGGGKTAIYVEAIAAAFEAGRKALVLVPEIALALPLVDRLRADLDAQVALVHSALGEGERADEWRRIRAGGADVVVGTRLAVLAPLDDVGLIVVDEEHEAAYKSDRTPRIQARDVAIALGRLAAAAVVLGSATPAVETVGRVRSGTYRRAVLPTRPSGAPPAIEVVDLRAELAGGNRGLLSARLAQALSTLDPLAGDRAILVINRRGTASVVLCRDCGAAQLCPGCDRPLVYHQAGQTLRCHHCGTAAPLASRCPTCRSPRIRYLGGGTERLEREVRERFGDLRVGRLDRDVAERKGAAERVIDAFAEGRLDVLVGTSLVAKGLDVPEVTLVGVVSADIALNLPDERAAERTYQLLAQAVGRAGRGDRPGLAIIQSYQPGHPAIRAVAEGDATRFYDAELALRARFGSPPFGRLVRLTVALPDRDAAEREADAMAAKLRTAAAARGSDITVTGPAPAYIARRGERWRFDVVLRGGEPAALLDGGLDAPWSVDVDPESLL